MSGLAAACLAVPFAGTARAQNAVADFYRGKQIKLLVGYGPGGGYDITARLVARHLGKFIPGHPDIVVQNMAGAGRMRAANYMYVNAPKDGTTFALIARDTPLLGLLGVDPNVQFDAHKFTWLGSSSSFANDAYVLVLGPKAPVHTDRRGAQARHSAAGARRHRRRRHDADVPKILRDTIGIRIKQVLGYTSIRRRSCLPSSAARSTAAPSISPTSRQRGRNGSNPTAVSISSCSSRGARAIPTCPTCRLRANSRPTPRRAS